MKRFTAMTALVLSQLTGLSFPAQAAGNYGNFGERIAGCEGPIRILRAGRPYA